MEFGRDFINDQDVRDIKTNNLIRTAFLALLAEKGFHAMTVQDILDRAQINRSTFYKHFPNKIEAAKVLVEELTALVKEKYIEHLKIENVPAEEDLDFQGHLFATITLGMMRYIIEKGEMPQGDALIHNVNVVFDQFVIRTE